MFQRQSKNSFKLSSLNENTKDPTAEEMREYLVSQYGDYEENKFDIEAAIYWFASLHHSGQNSDLYSALSNSDYNPGPSESAPVPGGDIKYTYLLDDIVYSTNELMQLDKSKTIDSLPLPSNGNFRGGGDDNNDDGDGDDGDEYWFRTRKSQLEFETSGEIDTDDLERKMREFLKQVTKKNIYSFSYELHEEQQMEESMTDMMFGDLVGKYS